MFFTRTRSNGWYSRFPDEGYKAGGEKGCDEEGLFLSLPRRDEAASTATATLHYL